MSAAAYIAEALHARANGAGWMARCVAHDDSKPSLSISEGSNGNVLVCCHAGCEQQAVIDALRERGLWPESTRPKGLTVAELAIAKRLPESLLRNSGFSDDSINGRPVIRMEYRGVDTTLICTRYRGSIEKGAARFWFQKGDKQQLYGLWRLRSEPVIVVEGETDTLALWDAGFNAIGVPGADAWRDKRFAELLKDCPTLYVHLEPDEGGQKFRAAFEKSTLADHVRFFTVAPAAKDPCQLRAREMDGFRAAIEVLLQEARPMSASPEDLRLAAAKATLLSAERRKIIDTARPVSFYKWNLRIGSNGAPISDEANVLIALDQADDLRAIARYDEFAQQLERGDAAKLSAEGADRHWRDTDTTALQAYLQQQALARIGREKINDALVLHARRHFSFHPVRDYLNALAWDGKARIDTFAATYLCAGTRQRSDYVRAAIRAWLISAVARIFQPGCQADYVLVLEGRQGIKKSTALRVLASDAWFSDSLPNDVGHKDSKAHLLGKWIIELPEFAQFKRSEIETVKAFITRRHEQFRPSYGRHEVTFERQCVFAGSTNEAEYLVDQTGNRRFWPIACGELDLPALVRDRDQLWAEAVHAYRSSEAWYLPAHIEALASTETQKRVTCDPWMGMVAQILDDLMPYVRDIAPGEVLAKMDIAKEQRNSRAAARVGAILRDLGWRRGNRHSTRGQLFERPDA